MPDYKFPSQIQVDLNEIEPALRRKKEKKRIDWFVVLMLAVILAGLLHFLVEPRIPLPTAHAQLKTDKQYCQEIKDGTRYVYNAPLSSVMDYCNSI